MKVSIIGMGHVGATIAYTIVLRGLAREVVLVSRDRTKAGADAIDLMHSLVFTEHNIQIEAGDIEQTAGSNVIVISASIPWKPDYTSRFDLAPGNIELYQKMLDQ